MILVRIIECAETIVKGIAQSLHKLYIGTAALLVYMYFTFVLRMYGSR